MPLPLLLPTILTLSLAPQPLTTALVLDPVTRAGRAPTFTCPIEHALATGAWTTPAAGDGVTPPDSPDPHTWRPITAGDNNVFSDPALRGGYALITIDAPEPRIALLDARAHRHVLVNGEPRVGDVYDLGSVRIPIHLRAGPNELLFRTARGTLAASLADPPAPVFIESRDRTLPNALVGDAAPLHAAVIVTNATADWQHHLTLTSTAPGAEPTITTLPPIPPLTFYKAPFTITLDPASLKPESAGTNISIALELRDAAGASLHTDTLQLTVRNPTDKHTRTFISAIDGSVQYFAVVPPRPPHPPEDVPIPPRPTALVLSLHGASVEATNQAGAYAHKDWATIVCPTNRRPFGFDWEDWGRWDALEVLTLAETLFETDPRRTYLTGHSMGGHGAWQLGAHFPGRFAAIAPCAAWPDFWGYGGAADFPDPTPVESILARSVNASRTLILEPNYAHAGVYIYHGDADTTVPVALARAMRERLARFHPSFAYHERPGEGHWAGDHAVDWPPLFDFFRHHTLPEPHAQRRIAFTTASPSVNARCGWVTINTQHRSMDFSSIDAAIDLAKRTLTISTANVAHLSLDLAPFAARPDLLPPGQPLTVTIDTQTVGGESGVPWPADSSTLHFARIISELDIAWELSTPPPLSHKSPSRHGPFKDAFRNNVLFVYGTHGDPDETAALLAKARYDAETFWYRGNGAIQILPDTAFDPAAHPDRSIILYGSADTNAAWPALLPPDSTPFDVRRGSLRIADRTLTGDALALLAIHPRSDSPTASIGVVAATGLPGQRLTHQLPYFVSGVAYPDWIVLSTDIFTAGARGVKAAGFFANDWQYDPSDSAWLDPPPE